MILFTGSKINIGLNILSKRKDGFHNIETAFYPLKLSDILEINPSNKEEFHYTGIKIDSNKKNNLCYKAYALMKEKYDIPPVKLHLHKSVPFGAGLGGGSANAAGVIKACNKIFGLKLSFKELKDLAANIGSDCAFFIKGTPALGYEKGDKLKNIILDLSSYYIVIAVPTINISTKEAYSGITPNNKRQFSIKEIIESKNINKWQSLLYNDFEKNILNNYNDIKKIKEYFNSKGSVYSSLSGSGSAVYGLFKNKPDLKFDSSVFWGIY